MYLIYTSLYTSFLSSFEIFILWYSKESLQYLNANSEGENECIDKNILCIQYSKFYRCQKSKYTFNAMPRWPTPRSESPQCHSSSVCKFFYEKLSIRNHKIQTYYSSILHYKRFSYILTLVQFPIKLIFDRNNYDRDYYS